METKRSARQEHHASQQRIQRVPPHDLTLEKKMLGAAMLRADQAEICAGLTPDVDFYDVRHKTIAAALRDLHLAGKATDAGTVGVHLRRVGQLDTAGGPAYLVDLTTDVPAYSAATWADMLADYSVQRTVLAGAETVVDSVYRGLPTAGLLAELHTAATRLDTTKPSSWELVNLASILTGEHVDIVPTQLAREDGQRLLYPAKIHAFNAEPEAGKTWLALLACTQAIARHEHALYIDFEGGAVDIVTRLLELGVEPAALLDRFHYIRPDDPLDASAQARVGAVLDAWAVTVAIVDGLAEALTLNNLKENDPSDVTTFFTRLPRRIAAAGAAVVILDHVVKDRENQGRYGRGSGAKLAGIDGASYKLEIVKPFGRGMSGVAKVLVTKDRHGWVRRNSNGGVLCGTLLLESENDGRHITLDLRAPEHHDDDHPFRPTVLMERVSLWLELQPDPVSVNAVVDSVNGKKAGVTAALRQLVAEGYVEQTEGPRTSKLHHSAHPYRREIDTTESDTTDDVQ